MTKKRNPINFWIITFSAILLISSGQFTHADAWGKNANKNKKPVAEANVDRMVGECPLSVQFDGSESFDDDGSIVFYKWKIKGMKALKGEVVNHVFDTPGNYIVKLIVKDDKGGKDIDRLYIEVTPKTFHIDAMTHELVNVVTKSANFNDRAANVENEALQAKVIVQIADGAGEPVADVMVAGKWGGLITGQSVSTTDAGGQAVFLSDPTSEKGMITFTVESAGTFGCEYTPDSDIVKEIEITTDASINLAPLAHITVNHDSGPANLSVDFCGKSCSDPDGTIVSYHWDFGDGATADCVQARNIYAEGSYKATLTVTDDKGLSSSTFVMITAEKGRR